MNRVLLYDATLREGSQSAQASFTISDKVHIAQMLDELGVSYIEVYNPAYNPKDAQLYRQLSSYRFAHARLCAFGSTCRVGVRPMEDAYLQALLEAQTPAVCIFGKSWDFHVSQVLGASLQQNIDMIADTVSYLKREGREVIFDAEHFFDGYKSHPDYAMQTLSAASQAGADWLCLCDTNGALLPYELSPILAAVRAHFPQQLGIHCHNDSGMAMANAISAVHEGVPMVQATIEGWGERCGNTDLCTLAANLELKMSIRCLADGQLARLTAFSRAFHDLAGSKDNPHTPYTGRYAFTHKGGVHIDAISKDSRSYEHVDPSAVGNRRNMPISEVAGRMAIFNQVRLFIPDIQKDSPYIPQILTQLKDMEAKGYQYEGAQASFELLVRKVIGLYKPFFQLKGFKVMINEPALPGEIASAMIHIVVDGEEEITAAVGNGPVNALDRAARRALERFYPSLRQTRLSDFRVRVLDSRDATAAPVRVLIESTDGVNTWNTVGVSTDIIDASWHALVDSLEYKLLCDQK